MSGALRSVRLSGLQMAYLANATYLPFQLREAVTNATDAGDAGPITIDAETADAMQSALTDRLGEAGFDAAYDLTEEGEMLEELIDAFADG